MNGDPVTVDADPAPPLLYVLADQLQLDGPVYQFGMRLPKVETVLIDRRDEPVMGAGECTITLAAAAIADAVFDATGARLRQVPLTPARGLEALAAVGA